VRYGSIGGLEYEVPQKLTHYCSAHTYYIFFGRPPIGGKLAPSPLWRRHCIGLRAQCDICDYHVSCCGVSMSAFVAANQSERLTEPVDFGGARRRNDDGCDGRTDGQTDRQTRSNVPRLQVCAVQARSADAASVVVQLITASSSPSPAAAATEGLEET